MWVDVTAANAACGQPTAFQAEGTLENDLHVQQQGPAAAQLAGSCTADDAHTIRLQARLSAQVPIVCASCGCPTTCTVTAEVDERFFLTDGPPPEEAYAYTGNRLDLAEMAAEWVTLLLPMAPLCEACASQPEEQGAG